MEPARTAASTHTDSAERISAASAGTAGGTDGTDARPDQGRQLPPAPFDETEKNGWNVLGMKIDWLRILRIRCRADFSGVGWYCRQPAAVTRKRLICFLAWSAATRSF